MKNFLSLLCMLCLTSGAEEFVTYEAFGAKGDGKENDGAAIVKAHQYANSHHLPVRAADTGKYYIGKMESPAVIQTDTDWGKAHFIIDDRNLFADRGKAVFQVRPSQDAFQISESFALKRGDTDLKIKPGIPALAVIEDCNVRHFIRKGPNRDSGAPQQEVLIVDKDGKIDPATPILWDYPAVTGLKYFPIDEKTLSIRGGIFTTIANNAPSQYTYYSRGIDVRRSNVKISGLRHVVTGEGETSAPYSSFISVNHASYVTIEDSFFSGHKIFWTIGNAGTRVAMGSYDLNAYQSCFVTLRNCRQLNFDDPGLWGIHASNYCRQLTVDTCTLSRFDAHMGVADAVIRNSALHEVSLIGFGTFLMENCTLDLPVQLRDDYGSFWRGKFILRNVTIRNKNLFYGQNQSDHDFGYPCMMPEEIILEKIRFQNTNGPATVFCGFRKPVSGAAYPYEITKKIVLHDVTQDNGGVVQLSQDQEFFKGCHIQEKDSK